MSQYVTCLAQRKCYVLLQSTKATCFWHNRFVYSDFSHYRCSSVHNTLTSFIQLTAWPLDVRPCGRHKEARSTETLASREFHSKWRMEGIHDGNERTIRVSQTQCFLALTTYQNHMKSFWEKAGAWDFPGGPVIETLCYQCRGPEFDPWSGN